MTTSSSHDINTFLDSTNENRVLKKLIRISDTMAVLPIPDSIIKKLHIDEDTWFEEIPTSQGIILKISSKKIGSCHDASESREANDEEMHA